MIFSSIKNKTLRIAVRVLAGIAAIIIILVAGLNIYILFNKDALLKNINDAISKNIAGKVEIKDIDVSTVFTFPYLAVNLHDVKVLDSVYSKPLLDCSTVSCRINIFKIGDVQHQLAKLVIQDGSIHFFKDTSGYTNSSIFSVPKKENAAKGQGFMIHNIALDNINFSIDDALRGKEFNFQVDEFNAEIIKESDSLLHINARQQTVIHKMIFNQAKGSYLQDHLFEGKLSIDYNSAAKTLICTKSNVEINKQLYTIEGGFRFADSASYFLNVISKAVKYEKGIGVLTPKLKQKLGNIKLEEPLAVHLVLSGLLAPGNIPVVNITWQTTDNQLTGGPVVFEECSFNGNFTNNIADSLPHTDEFSRILFESFSGKWRGLYLTGKDIMINNLSDPTIQFKFSSTATLPDIDNAIGSDAITFTKGNAVLALDYNGPLVADPAQLKNLSASLQIKDGSIIYEPKNMLLEKCSGIVSIGQNQLLLKNFQFDFKQNHFLINVQGQDVGNLSNTTADKAGIVFNIYSPYIHVNEIMEVLSYSENKSKKKSKALFSSTAKQIDGLFANSNWAINLTADKLVKGPFYAEKLKANLLMQQDNWDIQHLSFYHAGGSINVSGRLYNRSSKRSTLKTDVTLKQINVQKLFAGFSNFGQKSLTSANIRGILNADAHISMAINNSGAIAPRSMNGSIDFSIKNGAVINHKGLEEMKVLFLKNRDMSNVQFAELKDRIDITPDYLYINKMEIQSTAVSMYLEGKYDLYGKNTNLVIQVPFSNFGKRDENYEVKNKGLDARTGLSIWIIAQNDQYGEIKFKPTFSKKKALKSKER